MTSELDADAVHEAYCAGEEITNAELYKRLSHKLGLEEHAWTERAPVGRSCTKHNLLARKARWHQQTLRALGAIERVPGKRGVWRLTPNEKDLEPAATGVHLVAYSTDLGLALWGNHESVFSRISEPIALILTSPPYPLRKHRAYGGPTQAQYTDFVCQALEPLVKNLLPGGSIVLNISNDVFETGTPARSMYIERLLLALHDRLSLHLMDRLVWRNASKPPGPMQWASRTRQQLNVSWEPLLWLTNDPVACFADNRRVLQPHSDRHSMLIARGGEDRTAVYGDGAYTIRPGSFSGPTEGRIPRNILEFGHSSQEAIETRRAAQANGLPCHGATMPLNLARFLIEFMTRTGDLVADLFAGWNTTGLAAELTGRRWISTERMAQYAVASAYRFRNAPGFNTSFDLAQ